MEAIVSKGSDSAVLQGRFKKFRVWNRKRNYFFKKVKLHVKRCTAKIVWDKWSKSEFTVDTVKTILLLRNEGKVGDVVVLTPLLKCLTESGYSVDVLVTQSSSAVIKYYPYVRAVYKASDCTRTVFYNNFNHVVDKLTIKKLRENNYDQVVDLNLFEMPLHRMKLLNDINAKSALGFNISRHFNHYAKSIVFKDVTEHVTTAMSLVAEAFGVKLTHRLDYELYIPDAVLHEVKDYLNALPGRRTVIVNAFTGSLERNFSQYQLLDIITMLNNRADDIRIVIPDHRRELRVPLPANATINPFLSLHHVMALIHQADLVISPDTSIVHISAAWNKPMISVYKNDLDNIELWGPGYENASQIIIQQRKISDVAELPALIQSEMNRRGLLCRESASGCGTHGGQV